MALLKSFIQHTHDGILRERATAEGQRSRCDQVHVPSEFKYGPPECRNRRVLRHSVPSVQKHFDSLMMYALLVLGSRLVV